MSISNIEFVVAKYKEDIGWIDELKDTFRFTIYDKSETGTLPNYGREAHTYIHHIIENYDNLTDITVFLQGNPFEHMFVTQTEEIPKDQAIRIIRSYNYNCTEPFFCNRLLKENCNKTRNVYIMLFGYPPRSRYIEFTPGAQWIVKKEDILSRPYKFYKNIHELLKKPSVVFDSNIVTPWTMERLWHYIFNKELQLSRYQDKKRK